MMQARNQSCTCDQFIAWYPEHGEHRYELHQGTIIPMPKPKGRHCEIAGFLNGILFLHLREYTLPYLIPTLLLFLSS